MKPAKLSLTQAKIHEFAKRRAGATFADVASAAHGRLRQLRDDYDEAPPSYRGYLAVGICSCLETHIKYSYAAAAESFVEHPELLRLLLKDINVDIYALIATTSKSFHLADVVAASISVSSLTSYLRLARHFFSVLMEEPHDFPWDFVKMVKNGDPDLAKEFPVNLDRLNRVFDARHRFIHETTLLAGGDQSDLVDDVVLGGAGDALWLVSTFEMQFEHLRLWSRYSSIREDEGLNDAVERNLKDIQAAIALIKAECDETQF